jgi:Tfp pilus assembly major pilin PilA
MAVLGKEVGIADSIKLDTIKVVPNPYKASSRFNESKNNRKIRFTHLPKKCRISVYTLTGEHVTTFDHEEEFDGNAWWNLRSGNNQDGQEIAPGLYFYIVQFDDGITKDHIGKFAVVR